MRLAVIDADSGFIQVLAKRLERMGGELLLLDTAPAASALVELRAQALVVDLAVLGPAGWDALGRLCSELPAMPVLICSGPSTVADRVRALRLGADDWLGKPCHPEELIARAEAAMRRGRGGAARGSLEPVLTGGIEIRPDQYQAFAGERSLELTRREYELLVLLAGAEGRVLEREEIYRSVWGYSMVRGDRSVDVFVRKLRQKLERLSPEWRYLHTHFGVGYRFAPEPSSSPGRPAPAEAARTTIAL